MNKTERILWNGIRKTIFEIHEGSSSIHLLHILNTALKEADENMIKIKEKKNDNKYPKRKK